MTIQILYFARLRERLGTASETLPFSDALATVNDILGLLSARGGEWQTALQDEANLLCAVNQEMVARDTAVKDGDEVAFFPPVTGG